MKELLQCLQIGACGCRRTGHAPEAAACKNRAIGLSPARVHFQMRILAQLIDADEHAALCRWRRAIPRRDRCARARRKKCARRVPPPERPPRSIFRKSTPDCAYRHRYQSPSAVSRLRSQFLQKGVVVEAMMPNTVPSGSAKPLSGRRRVFVRAA